MINNLPKSLTKYKHMIQEYSDERCYGHGLWVYLKDEFMYEDGRTIINEDTIPQLRQELKNIQQIKGAKK